jgi:DNA-binding FrmR family transcriptional regulator
MSNCCGKSDHPDHKNSLPSLSRAAGQLEGVRKMIGERRYCPDILNQLRAVRAALRTVEADILERHLEGCVSDAITSGDADEKARKLDEIKQLFKKYEA